MQTVEEKELVVEKEPGEPRLIHRIPRSLFSKLLARPRPDLAGFLAVICRTNCRRKKETRRGDCLSSLYLFSNILPFVSIVHLWSDSPRGHRRAICLFLSLFPSSSHLLSHRGPVSSSRCETPPSSVSFSLFFCLFFSSPCPSTLQAPSFRSPIWFIKYAWARVCEKREKGL